MFLFVNVEFKILGKRGSYSSDFTYTQCTGSTKEVYSEKATRIIGNMRITGQFDRIYYYIILADYILYAIQRLKQGCKYFCNYLLEWEFLSIQIFNFN